MLRSLGDDDYQKIAGIANMDQGGLLAEWILNGFWRPGFSFVGVLLSIVVVLCGMVFGGVLSARPFLSFGSLSSALCVCIWGPCLRRGIWVGKARDIFYNCAKPQISGKRFRV